VKHTLLALFILLFTPLAGMDEPIRTKHKEIQFFQLASFPPIFCAHLPCEINGKILDTLVFHSPNSTKKDTAYLINRFSLTCKPINTFINEHTLLLIKKLSDRFNCSNESVAHELQTKVASEILLKQLGFSRLCGKSRYNRISPQSALHIKKITIDLNFTYKYPARTQLMFSSMATSESMGAGQPYIVKWLIKHGADINIVDTTGKPAILDAITTWNDGEKQLIEYFLDHPSFDINRIYGKHGTLLFSIVFPLPLSYKRSYKLNLIKRLCARGADPEIAFKETTLLQLKETDLELFTIVQEAITQKRIREQNNIIKAIH